MRIKKPNITIKQPDASFYRAAALEGKKRIRIRTETDGVDYKRRAFRPYTPQYKAYRLKKGRSANPNLSFSGKMLSSMKTTATFKKAFVTLSGEESLKAQGNESRGRVFFALSDAEKDDILKMVSRWMAKENGLK